MIRAMMGSNGRYDGLGILEIDRRSLQRSCITKSYIFQPTLSHSSKHFVVPQGSQISSQVLIDNPTLPAPLSRVPAGRVGCHPTLAFDTKSHHRAIPLHLAALQTYHPQSGSYTLQDKQGESTYLREPVVQAEAEWRSTHEANCLSD